MFVCLFVLLKEAKTLTNRVLCLFTAGCGILPTGVSSVSVDCGSCLPNVGGGSEGELALPVVVQVGPPRYVFEVFPVHHDQGGLGEILYGTLEQREELYGQCQSG